MLQSLYYQEDNYLEEAHCLVAESYAEEVNHILFQVARKGQTGGSSVRPTQTQAS